MQPNLTRILLDSTDIEIIQLISKYFHWKVVGLDLEHNCPILAVGSILYNLFRQLDQSWIFYLDS